MDLGKISVTPKGAYNSTTIYERLDIVSDSGKSYLSRIDKNNKPLTDLAAWQLLVEGSSIEELSDADIKEKYENNPNTNAFTDAEKVKLASLENFDDSAIQTELDTKVDKVAGFGLSKNNFSDAEKTKLENLQNFDPSGIIQDLGNKVDKIAGKGLSDNNYSTADKVKLASLENFDDSAIQTELDTKVDKVAGKSLSTNDYTTTEKNKLASLENYDDTALQAQIDAKIDFNTMTSEDESILLEELTKNVESNISMISEEYETGDTANLSFEAIQIMGVYDSGIKLNTTQYTIIDLQTIDVNLPRVGSFIEVQYTHLKTDI